MASGNLGNRLEGLQSLAKTYDTTILLRRSAGRPHVYDCLMKNKAALRRLQKKPPERNPGDARRMIQCLLARGGREASRWLQRGRSHSVDAALTAGGGSVRSYVLYKTPLVLLIDEDQWGPKCRWLRPAGAGQVFAVMVEDKAARAPLTAVPSIGTSRKGRSQK